MIEGCGHRYQKNAVHGRNAVHQIIRLGGKANVRDKLHKLHLYSLFLDSIFNKIKILPKHSASSYIVPFLDPIRMYDGTMVGP